MAYTSDDFWAQHDAMAAAQPATQPSTGIISQVKAPTNDNQKILDIRSKLTGVPASTLNAISSGQPTPVSTTAGSNDFWNQYNAIGAANGLGSTPPSQSANTNSTLSNNSLSGINAYQGYYPQSSQQAVTQQVTPQSTVSGQLDSLLSANSPYLEQARLAAMNQASSRGLLNSSLAAGAGEAAAIQSALPIATQDANTYFAQAQANQNARNQFGLNQQSSDLNADLARLNTALNTDSASRLARLNNDLQMQQNQQNFGFQSQLANQNYQNSLGLQNATFANNRTLQGDQFNQNLALQNNTAANQRKQQDLTNSQGLHNAYLTTVSQNNTNATTDINTILQTPGLTPEQQQTAISLREKQRDNDNQAVYDYYSAAPGWVNDWNTFG
jgi:hypothetical protein